MNIFIFNVKPLTNAMFIIYLLILLELKIIIIGSVIPITLQKNFILKQWQAIVRQSGAAGDAIICHSNVNCKNDFNAIEWQLNNTQLIKKTQNSSNDNLITCICLQNRLAFRQDKQKCVEKIDECVNPIMFKEVFSNLNSQKIISIPSISLPLETNDGNNFPANIQYQLLKNDFQILWKESAIKIKQDVGPKCNISAVKYMSDNAEWINGNANWFMFGWNLQLNTATISWNNKTSENINNNKLLQEANKVLNGALLLIELECKTGNTQKVHCMTFRVKADNKKNLTNFNEEDDEEAGHLNLNTNTIPDDINFFTNSSIYQMNTEHHGKFETIIIILLTILLFLSIFGSIVLWNICWRIKKTELISNLQMQFLYHIRQEKEKAIESQHRYHNMTLTKGASETKTDDKSNLNYNAFSNYYVFNNENIIINEINQSRQTDNGNNAENGVVAKRKIYFNSEFFEPYSMANPPPMADQFLYDLRKMITIAKQRITLKRHIPKLSMIAEEDENVTEAKIINKIQNKCQNLVKKFEPKLKYYSPVDLARNAYIFKTNYDSNFNYLSKNNLKLLNTSEITNEKSSPTSIKSLSDDSGHDTSVEATSNSSDGTSSTESASPANTPPLIQKSLLINSQKYENQKKFESYNKNALQDVEKTKNLYLTQISESIKKPNQQTNILSNNSSKIPISKSPRQQTKTLSLLNSASINIETSTTPQAYAQKNQTNNNNVQKSLIIHQNGSVASNKNLLPNTQPPPPPPPKNPPPPLPTHTISFNHSLNNTTKSNNETPKISQTPSHIKKQRLQNEITQNSSNGKNSYTLFPSDSMLKKSLPRRNKKSVTHSKRLSSPITNVKEKKSGTIKKIKETNI